MAGWWLLFLRSYLMAQKNFRRSGSGPSWKAWAVAHENMGIRRNSSFLAVNAKKQGKVIEGQ